MRLLKLSKSPPVFRAKGPKFAARIILPRNGKIPRWQPEKYFLSRTGRQRKYSQFFTSAYANSARLLFFCLLTPQRAKALPSFRRRLSPDPASGKH